MPRRWSGKTAALLPTSPNATDDPYREQLHGAEAFPHRSQRGSRRITHGLFFWNDGLSRRCRGHARRGWPAFPPSASRRAPGVTPTQDVRMERAPQCAPRAGLVHGDGCPVGEAVPPRRRREDEGRGVEGVPADRDGVAAPGASPRELEQGKPLHLLTGREPQHQPRERVQHHQEGTGRASVCRTAFAQGVCTAGPRCSAHGPVDTVIAGVFGLFLFLSRVHQGTSKTITPASTCSSPSARWRRSSQLQPQPSSPRPCWREAINRRSGVAPNRRDRSPVCLPTAGEGAARVGWGAIDVVLGEVLAQARNNVGAAIACTREVSQVEWCGHDSIQLARFNTVDQSQSRVKSTRPYDASARRDRA